MENINKNLYPRWVPNPRPPANKPDHSFLVHDPDEHKRKNPADYDAFQEKLAAEKTSPVSVSKGVLDEREHCAQIAESLQRGDKLGIRIAQTIRARGQSQKSTPVTQSTVVSEPSAEVAVPVPVA